MKLRYKLVVAPLIFSFIVFSFIILFTVYSYNRSSFDALHENQVHVVDSFTQTVTEYIYSYKNAVTQLETLDQVKDTSEFSDISVEYRGLSEKQGIEVRRLFKETIEIYPEFAYLETFTKEKAINVVLEPYQAQLDISESDYLKGFFYRDWYVGAMKTGTTYVSEAYLSASIMEPVVAISTPIYSNDESVVGIMIGALKLTKLSYKVESLKYGETGITYIVDKNSNLVAYPNSDYFGSESLYNLEDNEIMQSINENDVIDGSIRLYDNLMDEDVYVYYKKVPDTEWYIVSQISVREQNSKMLSILYKVIPMTIFVLLAYLLFLFLDTRSIVSRLSFLNSISNRMGEEEFELTEKEMVTFSKNNNKKDEIGTLMTTYKNMIVNIENNFEAVEILANHDGLTNLPNRRHFLQVLKDEIDKGTKGTVILMDMDNFKLINDTLGHVIGDEVLKASAKVLSNLAGEEVFVSRFGGDEFILYAKETVSEDITDVYMAQVYEYFSKPLIIKGMPIDVNFSIGITKFPDDNIDLVQLVRYADMALYEVKESGKNHFLYFDRSMEDTVFYKSNIEKELKKSISEDAFKLVYQPQIDLRTGRVSAYEALIRMKNNKYIPSEFIPIAEETGQIIHIGRWVLKTVIRQISLWENDGFSVKPISVNFSAIQLQDTLFLEFMEDLLNLYKVDIKLIELEVTENVFIGQHEAAKEFFRVANRLGVKLSIDDFGTGYSSLNYIMTLPIHKIKLDRSLSEQFLYSERIETIKSIIRLSHSLDLEVVAEGIECGQEVAKLVEANCDYVQGFYFNEAIEVNEVGENLTKQWKIEEIDEK